TTVAGFACAPHDSYSATELRRHRDPLRPEVLAERLRLRIDPGIGGRALAQEPSHHEVEGAEVGEDVPFDLERGGFRDEPAELLDREGVGQPRERLRV